MRTSVVGRMVVMVMMMMIKIFYEEIVYGFFRMGGLDNHLAKKVLNISFISQRSGKY